MSLTALNPPFPPRPSPHLLSPLPFQKLVDYYADYSGSVDPMNTITMKSFLTDKANTPPSVVKAPTKSQEMGEGQQAKEAKGAGRGGGGGGGGGGARDSTSSLAIGDEVDEEEREAGAGGGEAGANKVTLEDFELLRVIGKVRRRSRSEANPHRPRTRATHARRMPHHIT